MNELPNEILRMVFSHLSPEQRHGVDRVSNLFQFLSLSLNSVDEICQETQYFIKNAKKLELDPETVKQLEAFDAFTTVYDADIIHKQNFLLDAINETLIRKAIDPDSTTLNVSGQLTRFPITLLEDVTLRSYWKKLVLLNCSYNKLTNLPDLSKLKALNILDCRNNQLQDLSSLSNLKDLLVLYCNNNQLFNLPDLTRLKYLNCNNNKISNLPPKLCKKFGNDWVVTTLNSQKTLLTISHKIKSAKNQIKSNNPSKRKLIYRN